MDGLAQPREGSSEYTSMNRPASVIAVTVPPVGVPHGCYRGCHWTILRPSDPQRSAETPLLAHVAARPDGVLCRHVTAHRRATEPIRRPSQ